MSEIDNEVKKILDANFPKAKIRHTEKGFKLNVESLNKVDMMILSDLPCTNPIEVKRSGTGLVVIIE